MNYELKCTQCGKVIQKEPCYKCEACGGIVDIAYKLDRGMPFRQNAPGIYAFAGLLPLKGRNYVSLFEGNTPLIDSKRFAIKQDMPGLWYKNEGMNPTGSFKDRAMALAVAKSLEYDINTLIVASSGNGSAAMAAYAARSGQKAVVLVPETTPANKILQACAYGARVFKVKGPYSNSFMLAKQISEKYGWFNCTSTYINPYAREGYKTIGYEIYEQLGFAPDWILLPVGAGPILAAVYKAFVELRGIGYTEKIPRVVCVQAARCCPISEGWLKGGVRSWETSLPTVASGINDDLKGYTEDGDYTVQCIRESGGTAVALTEEEIVASVADLGEEGIFAEPAGAVGIGALHKLLADNVIKRHETAVIAVTGSGLKNPVPVSSEEPPVVASAGELIKRL